jgi:iron complex transport system substrate-binding protein
MLKINHLRRFASPVLGFRLGRSAVPGLVFVLAGSLFCAFSGIALCACGGDAGSRGKPAGQVAAVCADSVEFGGMQYSRMLRVGKSCGQGIADVRSVIGRDTLVQRFALVDDSALSAGGLDLEQVQRGAAWKGATVLHVPLRRAVVLSSAQIGYMLRLGAGDRIAGVGEGRFVVDSTLYARIAAGKVAEVGNGHGLVLEKVLGLKPEIVMTFATGGGYDDYERLQALGIPMMLTSEWQEDSPLAKFEWIKLFGLLFCGRSGELACPVPADSVFEQSKSEYVALSSESTLPADRPRVLVGMSYGGVWYAPGGRSFTAQLIRDAGGRYLWESDTTREMKLSLEEVFAIADSADIWINPGAFTGPDEILAAEPRVQGVRAFREGRVYQNDGIKGPGGGNDFYEGAVANPVELLANVIGSIYPDSISPKKPDLENKPYKWYRNIFKF